MHYEVHSRFNFNFKIMITEWRYRLKIKHAKIIFACKCWPLKMLRQEWKHNPNEITSKQNNESNNETIIPIPLNGSAVKVKINLLNKIKTAAAISWPKTSPRNSIYYYHTVVVVVVEVMLAVIVSVCDYLVLHTAIELFRNSRTSIYLKINTRICNEMQILLNVDLI